MKSCMVTCSFLAALMLLWVAPVLAEDGAAAGQVQPAQAVKAGALSAEEIMRRMDKNMSGYADQYMKVKLTVYSKELGDREVFFEVWQKGGDKRLIHFLQPGNMRDMKVLIQDHDHMYVYLPSQKRVRRTAANNMKQGFAGSDFTNEDMATASYADDYAGTLAKEDAEAYYIKAVPRPTVKSDYEYLELKVRKDNFNLVQILFFKGGKAVKAMRNTDLITWPNGETRAKKVVMEDLLTGHRSQLDLDEFKTNQGYDENMFTSRYLQWGR